MVSIHSFTPVYKGKPRSVELGILHDRDTTLSSKLIKSFPNIDARLNEPYGPKDGVLHTLNLHGFTRGLQHGTSSAGSAGIAQLWTRTQAGGTCCPAGSVKVTRRMLAIAPRDHASAGTKGYGSPAAQLEGFLGAACRHGTLHLNEDTLVIERTPVKGTKRFTPIITDLRRTTQPMVRVQLDDLLEPVDTPCPCGSALLAVRGVEGRVGDLWRWGDVVIAPRDVEDAVSGAVGADIDWCAVGSNSGVRLEIETRADAAVAAVEMLLPARGVKRTVGSAGMAPMEGFKRRRVRWRDG